MQDDTGKTPETPRMFPIIINGAGRRMIPWALAEEAYAVYSGHNGLRQSLERLAERGGFHDGEMDTFVPDWRVRADTISLLQAKVTHLEAALREAEAKAARAIERERETDGELKFYLGRNIALLKQLDALQQPRADKEIT